MKIEKISDNQIKCTLNKSDLASRQIKISELAYGSDKAKNLFRDMMQVASSEFGFEAEDIPLMIEAIPVSSDCIVLIITKVEDPEELDTRFSRFAPASDDIDDTKNSSPSTAAAGLLDMLKQVGSEIKNLAEKKDNSNDNNSFIPLPDALKNTATIDKSAGQTSKSVIKKDDANSSKNSKEKIPINFIKIYSFDDINTIIQVARILKDLYNGNNSLYKSIKNNKYLLIVNQSNHSVEIFNRVCNILLEYGTLETSATANEAYFKEHYTKIIPKKALQKLLLIDTAK